jgi:hypothetical protein
MRTVVLLLEPLSEALPPNRALTRSLAFLLPVRLAVLIVSRFL